MDSSCVGIFGGGWGFGVFVIFCLGYCILNIYLWIMNLIEVNWVIFELIDKCWYDNVCYCLFIVIKCILFMYLRICVMFVFCCMFCVVCYV